MKRRQYREDEYWGKPVPGFGDPKAKIWIVGLAPGAHGSNRTGRMFTGDGSGLWLYAALHRHGFATLPASHHRTDKLKLKEVFISAAGRCAPPGNKPTKEELENCAPFLDEEMRLLKDAEGFLALGAIAFKAITTLLKRHNIPVVGKFGHGSWATAGKYWILSSYHPSLQNTQTGLLTAPMWDSIFQTAREKITVTLRT